MASSSAAAVAGNVPAPATRLEPGAIGVAQDMVIGMASSAPAATIGLVLAGLAAATAYGSGPVLLLTAVPKRSASGRPAVPRVLGQLSGRG